MSYEEGEKPHIRRKMESFTKELVESGHSPEFARRKATECARRVDRNTRENGGMRERKK